MATKTHKDAGDDNDWKTNREAELGNVKDISKLTQHLHESQQTFQVGGRPQQNKIYINIYIYKKHTNIEIAYPISSFNFIFFELLLSHPSNVRPLYTVWMNRQLFAPPANMIATTISIMEIFVQKQKHLGIHLNARKWIQVVNVPYVRINVTIPNIILVTVYTNHNRRT